MGASGFLNKCANKFGDDPPLPWELASTRFAAEWLSFCRKLRALHEHAMAVRRACFDSMVVRLIGVICNVSSLRGLTTLLKSSPRAGLGS